VLPGKCSSIGDKITNVVMEPLQGQRDCRDV
jgi:hypothetical protein